MNCRQKYAVKPPSARKSRRVWSRGAPSGCSSRARAWRWKRGTSVSIRRNAGRRRFRPVGKSPRRPSAPAYSRPAASSRTDIDISEGWVADADLGEEAQQGRVGALVVDDEAGVDGQAVDVVGVGVAAEPGVGLVERDVGGPRGDVRRRQPRHAGSDDRDPCVVGSCRAVPPEPSSAGRARSGRWWVGRSRCGLDGDRGGLGRGGVALQHGRLARRPASGRPRPCPAPAAAARAGRSCRASRRGRPCR